MQLLTAEKPYYLVGRSCSWSNIRSPGIVSHCRQSTQLGLRVMSILDILPYVTYQSLLDCRLPLFLVCMTAYMSEQCTEPKELTKHVLACHLIKLKGHPRANFLFSRLRLNFWDAVNTFSSAEPRYWLFFFERSVNFPCVAVLTFSSKLYELR